LQVAVVVDQIATQSLVEMLELVEVEVVLPVPQHRVPEVQILVVAVEVQVSVVVAHWLVALVDQV
jgi:hypothetical protein